MTKDQYKPIPHYKQNTLLRNEKDIENFKLLMSLVEQYPKHFPKILKSKKKNSFSHLLNWIDELLPQLVNYHISTKIHWILYGLTDFPTCPTCGKKFGYGCNVKVREGYATFCSRACVYKNKHIQEKTIQTKIQKYGKSLCNVEALKNKLKQKKIQDPDYYSKIANKIKQTKQQRYNDPNFNNRTKAKQTFKQHKDSDENFLRHINEKTRQTKLKNHGDPTFTNPEKNKQTRLKNNNGIYETAKQKEKRLATFANNHDGHRTPFSIPNVRRSIAQHNLEKYGAETVLKCDEIKQKIKQTLLEKYGIDHIWKSDIHKEKARDTMLQKYGTLNIRKCCYDYDNEQFDSEWELIVWIYFKEHGAKLKRNPKIFEYEFNGKLHKYVVDMQIDNLLVEVKGDMFFKEDGTM